MVVSPAVVIAAAGAIVSGMLDERVGPRQSSVSGETAVKSAARERWQYVEFRGRR